jgi:hypothetical protein
MATMRKRLVRSLEAFGRMIDRLALYFRIDEHEIGTPCPYCGHAMIYKGSDSHGTWFLCGTCNQIAYRRR